MAPLHIVRCGALRNDAQGLRFDSILIRQIDSIALSSCAITAPKTPSALDTNHSAFGAALRCRPFIAITNAANRESTFNMGRRIMAERGRRQRRRARRVAPRPRRDTATAIDSRGDAALRAFVRVLARQAAREVFESELRRTTSAVH